MSMTSAVFWLVLAAVAAFVWRATRRGARTGAVARGSGSVTRRDLDAISVTLFSPDAISSTRSSTLFAYAHLSESFAADPQSEPIPDAVQKDVQRLLDPGMHYAASSAGEGALLPQHTNLVFNLELSEGAEVLNPVQVVQWVQPFVKVAFEVVATEGHGDVPIEGRLTVQSSILLVAEIPVSLRVGEEAGTVRTQAAPAFRRVFPSYSHEDTDVVEIIERVSEAMGDEYLRDVTTLKSGQPWSEELQRLIEEADVFQLFWSSKSMRSKEVEKEWEHALALGRPNFVRPVYWESELPQSESEGLPPPALERLHFHRLAFDPHALPTPAPPRSSPGRLRSLVARPQILTALLVAAMIPGIWYLGPAQQGAAPAPIDTPNSQPSPDPAPTPTPTQPGPDPGAGAEPPRPDPRPDPRPTTPTRPVDPRPPISETPSPTAPPTQREEDRPSILAAVERRRTAIELEDAALYVGDVHPAQRDRATREFRDATAAATDFATTIRNVEIEFRGADRAVVTFQLRVTARERDGAGVVRSGGPTSWEMVREGDRWWIVRWE